MGHHRCGAAAVPGVSEKIDGRPGSFIACPAPKCSRRPTFVPDFLGPAGLGCPPVDRHREVPRAPSPVRCEPHHLAANPRRPVQDVRVRQVRARRVRRKRPARPVAVVEIEVAVVPRQRLEDGLIPGPSRRMTTAGPAPGRSMDQKGMSSSAAPAAWFSSSIWGGGGPKSLAPFGRARPAPAPSPRPPRNTTLLATISVV
jgi:hypothetical protein